MNFDKRNVSPCLALLLFVLVPASLQAGPFDSDRGGPTEPGDSGGAWITEGEDCAQPIMVGKEKQEIQIVTTGRRNDLDWQSEEVLGVAADGPDVVLSFEGLRWGTYAELGWVGDFDAAIYVVFGSCDRSCSAADRGREVSLEFSTPYVYEERMNRVTYFLVVDGIQGAAGQGTLRVEWFEGESALERTWGQVKSLYRD